MQNEKKNNRKQIIKEKCAKKNGQKEYWKKKKRPENDCRRTANRTLNFLVSLFSLSMFFFALEYSAHIFSSPRERNCSENARLKATNGKKSLIISLAAQKKRVSAPDAIPRSPVSRPSPPLAFTFPISKY